jgi:hypothetical protein
MGSCEQSLAPNPTLYEGGGSGKVFAPVHSKPLPTQPVELLHSHT